MSKQTLEEEMQEAVNVYLDELQESGETNMYGAGTYLREEFGFDKREASKHLMNWMHTFEERHPQ